MRKLETYNQNKSFFDNPSEGYYQHQKSTVRDIVGIILVVVCGYILFSIFAGLN